MKRKNFTSIFAPFALFAAISCNFLLTGCNEDNKMNYIYGFDASAESDSWNKGRYKNESGEKNDIFEILKDHGVNYIRLRVWNDPKNVNNPEEPGLSNLETLVKQAKRVKALGLGFLLDFHYSDYWADPGKQAIPQAWLSCTTSEQVAEKLSDWTSQVLSALNDAKASPDMIQIGNEINSGILTGYYENKKLKPLSSVVSGSSSRSPKNYIKYLQSGIDSARKNCPQAKIMLHLAEGGGKINWLLDMYKDAGLDYDIIGLSYYPFEKSHGDIDNLAENIKSFRKTYGKEVVIAETAHPFMTDNPKSADLVNATANLTHKNGLVYEGIEVKNGLVTASVKNQAAVIKAVSDTAKASGARGFFTWGGEYLGSWKYGMFSDAGHPLASLKVFKN